MAHIGVAAVVSVAGRIQMRVALLVPGDHLDGQVQVAQVIAVAVGV